jgi:ribonuclease HI
MTFLANTAPKWAAQIRRIARPSWGLTPKAAKRLYIGVALPRILYGLEVWCDPPNTRRIGKNGPATTKAAKKLSTIQREGALAITGGFRTSPSDALDSHAALLPMPLKIGKVRHRAAVRLASLPPSHPLHKPIRKAKRRWVRRHRSQLHHMAQYLTEDPDKVESIPVVRANPALTQAASIQYTIPQDKEASKRADAQSREQIKVYTDGSMHNGAVGAAATLIRRGKPPRTLRYHLGPDSSHTVYEAELVGILLGLQLIRTEKRSNTSCAIGADNQAAIQALQAEETKPGQHIAAEILKLAEQIKKERKSDNYGITIRWTAGHCGIEGNEKADLEAKRAAEGSSSNARELPKYLRKPLRKSISALRQAYSDHANKEWTENWKSSERYKRLQTSDTVPPHSSKFLKLTSDHRITRKMASIMFQLRTGHIPLNSYLHRFKKVDHARCPACGDPKESVEHYMLRCPAYAHERWPLRKFIGDSVPRLEKLLSNPKAIFPLINYIHATGRFDTKSEEQQQDGAR